MDRAGSPGRCRLIVTAMKSQRRAVVTTEDGTITLTIYEGAERLACVTMNTRQTVAIAGDLINVARTAMERQRYGSDEDNFS